MLQRLQVWAFSGIFYVVVNLVMVSNGCILGDGIVLMLLSMGLGVPKGFLSVILDAPGSLKALDCLVPGSVWPYQSHDKVVKGFIVEIRAFCKVRVSLNVWLLGLCHLWFFIHG